MKSPLEPKAILQDRYLIEEILESTERYRIYLAEDQQAGSENCILREFAASDVNEVVRVHEKFMPIVHQLQPLSHPQLEKFKDFFIQGANLYLVQSYFEGQTYQTRLSRDLSLTEDKAIQLLRQTLPVLSYLHSQSLIHGDISPSHLLLRSPDGALILTHFGILQEIAAQMGIETVEAKLLDKVEGLSGVPSGAGQDLSALAVTVLMLLTGKEPQDLFNRQTQTWDWEDYRLLSDRLTDVLNQMLPVTLTAPLPAADGILALLESPKIVQPTPALPPPFPIKNTEQFNHDIYAQPSPVKAPAIRELIILVSAIGAFAVIASLVAIQSRNENNSSVSPPPTDSFPSVSPIFSPTPTPSKKPYLNESEAVSIIENLYNLLSTGKYDQAVQLFSPQLAEQFNAQFFGQFSRVTVENLQITSRTDSMINLVGQNTYVYPDGSTQRELRSYRVESVGGEVKITASEFIKVTKLRSRTSSSSPSQTPIPSPLLSSGTTNATVGGTPGTKNMRSGAGTVYGVVGTVRTGDRVQILRSSYDNGGYLWYQVYHPQSGTSGWIAAQLINID